MLHSDLQTILFSNGMKLGIPDTDNAIHLDNAELQRKARLIATIDLKLRQYGYELDSKGVKKLKNLSDTDIVSFYTAIEPIVKNASGAHIADADIFYPNFPKEVLDKDELSLYMNAFFYYCGEYFLGEDLRPLLDIEKPKQRSSLIESFDRKNTIIRLVDEKEIDQLMLNCTRQSTPMSLSQFEDFKLYCKHTPDWKEKILSQNIPCKENAVQLAMYMYDSYSNKDMTHAQFMKYVSVLLKDTPDVLRFAALISNRHLPQDKQNDVSLKSKKVWFRFNNNSERNLIKELLNRCPNLAADVWQREEVYKALFRNGNLQINKKCPARLYKVVKNLLHNKKEDEHGYPILTSGRQLNDAIDVLKTGYISPITKFAQIYPGDFLRAFSRCMDANEDPKIQKHLCDILSQNADRMDIKVLIQLKEFMLHRHEREFSVDFVKNTFRARTNPAFGKELSFDVKSYFEEKYHEALVKACSDKKNLGKCYLDEDLRRIAVPDNNTRESSKSSVLPAFSRINANKECNIIRPFVWWTNNPTGFSVDLDLSAAFLDENYSNIDFISYSNLRNNFGCHSGDFVDGGDVDKNGVSEYIDIDKNALKERNVKYVAIYVHAYSDHPFNQLQNSKFGFMERYEPVFDTEKMLDVDTEASINGTIFDARTLSSNIVDLNTKSKQSLMTIYDVDRDCFIWIDKDLSLRYGCHNITNPDSVKGAVAVTYKATNYSFASLYELLKAQIEANGKLVENVEDADHIFLSTPRDFKNATLKENVEIVTGYDLSKICNEYLIRQNDPISETKLVKNSVKINTEVNTPSVNTDEKNINVKIEEFAR